MPMAPFDPITAIYTPAHAWMYETIVAPAVYRSRHVIDEYFLPHLPPNARILDVGSGGALFTNYIADQRPRRAHSRPRSVGSPDQARHQTHASLRPPGPVRRRRRHAARLPPTRHSTV